MATAKLKNGKTLELPFEEMLDFVALNPGEVEPQKSEKPMPRRRVGKNEERVA